MFSTKEQLIKRTGKNGLNRYAFLEQLVDELNTTKSRDAKEQVIANLANFAYDPINYGYLRKLGAIDVFLHGLSQQNPKIVCYAIKGLCNLSADSVNKAYILRKDGVQLISPLLDSQNEEILLSALTTLMYLMSPESKDEITCSETVEKIQKFTSSSSARIRNLATIFLSDYCKIEESGKESHDNTSVDQSLINENHAAQQENTSLNEELPNNVNCNKEAESG